MIHKPDLTQIIDSKTFVLSALEHLFAFGYLIFGPVLQYSILCKLYLIMEVVPVQVPGSLKSL